MSKPLMHYEGNDEGVALCGRKNPKRITADEQGYDGRDVCRLCSTIYHDEVMTLFWEIHGHRRWEWEKGIWP